MTRDLRRVCFSLFLWGIGEGLFFFFEPLYLAELGAHPAEIGLILGLAGAALTLSHVPAGALADRFGSRTMLWISWIMATVATALMFAAGSLALFIVGLVGYHLSLFVMAPLSSYATLARGSWNVARAMTFTIASFYAGLTLGPVVGGILGEAFGLRRVYGLAALIFVGSTAIILTVGDRRTADKSGPLPFKSLVRNVPFVRFLAIFGLLGFGMYLSWPLTPNFLQGARGVTLSQIGLFGSFNALGVVVLNLSLGRIGIRVGLLLTQALVAVSVAMLWLGTGWVYFALGYLFAGALRTANSLALAHAESLVDPRQVGVAYGFVETALGTVTVLAPPLAGILFARSAELPFPVSLGIMAGAAVLLISFWNRRSFRVAPAVSALETAHLGRE